MGNSLQLVLDSRVVVREPDGTVTYDGRIGDWLTAEEIAEVAADLAEGRRG